MSYKEKEIRKIRSSLSNNPKVLRKFNEFIRAYRELKPHIKEINEALNDK